MINRSLPINQETKKNRAQQDVTSSTNPSPVVVSCYTTPQATCPTMPLVSGVPATIAKFKALNSNKPVVVPNSSKALPVATAIDENTLLDGVNFSNSAKL